jgi:hypothetical protein
MLHSAGLRSCERAIRPRGYDGPHYAGHSLLLFLSFVESTYHVMTMA